MSEAQWPFMLSDYFGKKWSKGEAGRWLEELRRELGQSLTDDDICNAIRSRSFTDKKQFGQPTLKDLRMWVYIWRGKDEVAAPDIEESDSLIGIRDFVKAIRAKMDAAVEPWQLWNALLDCDIMDSRLKIREGAEEYAIRHKPGLYYYYDDQPIDQALAYVTGAFTTQARQWQREPGEEG